MKKFIAILLTFACLLILGACGAKDDGSQLNSIKNAVEQKEETMLTEVTDSGNDGLNADGQARISTEELAEIIANNPTMFADNYVHNESDGTFIFIEVERSK